MDQHWLAWLPDNTKNHSIIPLLNLDIDLWYLDDGTIVGRPNDALHALQLIIKKANEVGLKLNHKKFGISILGSNSKADIEEITKTFQLVSLGIQWMGNEFLSDSRLTDQAAIFCLDKKITELQHLSAKLTKISAYSAWCQHQD